MWSERVLGWNYVFWGHGSLYLGTLKQTSDLSLGYLAGLCFPRKTSFQCFLEVSSAVLMQRDGKKSLGKNILTVKQLWFCGIRNSLKVVVLGGIMCRGLFDQILLQIKLCFFCFFLCGICCRRRRILLFRNWDGMILFTRGSLSSFTPILATSITLLTELQNCWKDSEVSLTRPKVDALSLQSSAKLHILCQLPRPSSGLSIGFLANEDC